MLTKIKPLNHMTKPTRENQKPKNDIHYYSAVATEQTSAKLSLDIQEKICRQKSEKIYFCSHPEHLQFYTPTKFTKSTKYVNV